MAGDIGNSEASADNFEQNGHLKNDSSDHPNYAATQNKTSVGEQLGMGIFQWYLLFAAGLCFAADSMEVLLLSFLALVVQVEWELSEDQTNLIISSVFAGAIMGTLILGYLGDRVGRKPIFIVTAAIIAVFGLATAVVNTYEQLVLVRFFVGFGVGGLNVPFDTLAEFVPSSHRGSNLLIIEYFWCFGTMVVPIFAYFTLGEGTGGEWRVFVFLCAIPCIISAALAIMCVPESPRWLLAQGDKQKALEILRRAAKINGKDPMSVFPEGIQLQDDSPEGPEATVCDLMSTKWIKITLNLWGVWLSFAILYYGAIIMVTQVFGDTVDDNPNDNVDANSYSFDYVAIFVSAFSEVVGLTIVLYSVDRCGRIPSQIISYFLGGCMILALCFLAMKETTPRSVLIVLAFLSRMFMMGGSCTTWVSTAEILTTEIRTTGHSWSNAVARVGGFIVPFIVSSSTPLPTIGITFLVIGIFASVCTWNLPETKGAALGVASSAQDQQQGEGGEFSCEGELPFQLWRELQQPSKGGESSAGKSITAEMV